MDSFMRQEKAKRLNMEQRIEKRLVNEGLIILESGSVLTTPKQAWVDLSVREQQLGSATEALRQASTDNSRKDSQLHKTNLQLRNFRRAQKTKNQKEKQEFARDFTNETTRCRCFYESFHFFRFKFSCLQCREGGILIRGCSLRNRSGKSTGQTTRTPYNPRR
jgi:hypothetical protein